MTAQEAAELLDLIIERASALRTSGVLNVNLGGASFTLAPAEVTTTSIPDDDDGPVDTLHDPVTHGRPPGANLKPKRHTV